MPGPGLVDAGRLYELDEAQLNRIVTVGGRRFSLHHHARSRLEQRDRHSLSVSLEDLGHSDFLAKNSWTHVFQLPAIRMQLSGATR
jgi:hypothetical protein